ncbi:ABC transporter ATP-binding protein [Agrobacterium tumefaciens]|uniref:ABC transporter ATP-binding protein n=1 Tax=Agrobacterium tumefaciens TaxID=358 RepID=UPI0015743103|nr:ABC transporter ATP-binding protein [Agrobacterium tumefaciens]NTC82580.1 ABC transporter ATP-binding protein [Agrobacterium tumefaciens]NTD11403.1 ABC transporter ATP-binding protein [Agrobacterium tumefaciens]NTD86724.1 ABC transporter ATP-binding protein [Agrobacterium tumefaciens]NTD91451.1 ABC transporter ATP-binding protein [Agrobacterium tumefaciens]NTD96922.1 ABC transporter ATP-binding protein [Agrobacterium tumefaciens]
MSTVLAVKDLSITFGSFKAVDRVSLSVDRHQIVSVIGPNGAGKTTFFNVLSGAYKPTSGQVKLGGEDVTRMPPHRLARLGLSRTFQNLQIFFRMSALENVMVGNYVHERTSLLAQFLQLPSVRRENHEACARAEEQLEFVGLLSKRDHVAGGLSYGALKRLEIARALASRPKVLLLDEPAAGCNAVETAELDEIIIKIAKSGVSVLLVEHDMKLVMKISDEILVLDRGRVLAHGSPSVVRQDPNVIQAYLGAELKAEAERA